MIVYDVQNPVLSFLLLSLPSLVVTFHPMILVIIPKCAIPLSGIGALIGSTVRTRYEGGALSLVFTVVMAGLGPVVGPPDRLPRTLIVLGRPSPATYAASTLRQVLLGPLTGQIVVDLAVLSGFAAVIFWLVGRTMDWRQR